MEGRLWSMTNLGWEPLPADVAEWMGMDESMVPFILDVTDSSAPSSQSAEARSSSSFS
jgi:hypothetical protein